MGVGLGYFIAGGRDSAGELGPQQTLADTATVLVAVRGLARLESVAFHMERVIDLKERQDRLFGLIRADDAILLIAAGDVIAGVDLAKMRDGDVLIDPDRRSVRVRLPSAEICPSASTTSGLRPFAKDDLPRAAGSERRRKPAPRRDAIRDAALRPASARAQQKPRRP